VTETNIDITVGLLPPEPWEVELADLGRRLVEVLPTEVLELLFLHTPQGAPHHGVDLSDPRNSGVLQEYMVVLYRGYRPSSRDAVTVSHLWTPPRRTVRITDPPPEAWVAGDLGILEGDIRHTGCFPGEACAKAILDLVDKMGGQ
jgi:hypothetical protein